MTSQFFDMTSLSNFSNVVLFLLSSLVTVPSFKSISSLVQQLWQLWPKTWKSEITRPEFCLKSGDCDELWIATLTRISLRACYWMIQNARVTANTVFELLRQNQQGEGVELPPTLPPPTQIKVKITTQCKERKDLIPKVGTLGFILLIISIPLNKIDMN